MENLLEKVELYNVGGYKKVPYGYRLYRFPQEVMRGIEGYGTLVCAYPDNCEVRFVREKGAYVRVCVMSENGEGQVTVMYGDRRHSIINAKPGVVTAIDINDTKINGEENEEFHKDEIFDSSVVRVIFTNACFVLCDVECFGGDIRPPKPEEAPSKTFVAYGSSITHNCGAIVSPLNYINQTARLLGMQVLNKGMGGSCFAEKVMADYITGLDYEFLIYEIGTNMYNVFTEQEVYDRGKYLINEHFKKHPNTYLFLIEPLMPLEKYRDEEKYNSFMENVRKLHKDINNEKCVLIPASVVEDKLTYLSCDGIHPSTEGHMAMGINVANVIKNYIK